MNEAIELDSTAEMDFAHELLMAWAAWVYGGGKLSAATFANVMNLGVDLMGHIPVSEDILLAVDHAIAQLPPPMRALIKVHYRSSDDEPMSRRYQRTGYARSEYRLQLKAMQAAVYACLMPAVRRWQHDAGY